MIIFGITGTIGAGKGTIVDYLVSYKKFVHFSVRQFLIDELNLRKLEVNRDTMTFLANDLRQKYNSAYIIECLAKKAISINKNCIIESIRTPGEIDFLRKMEHFYLLSIDAAPKIRYERIVLRKSETDAISFETFLENEKREMLSQDPNKQNLSKCIEMADFKFNNDSEINVLISELNKLLLQLSI